MNDVSSAIGLRTVAEPVPEGIPLLSQRLAEAPEANGI